MRYVSAAEAGELLREGSVGLIPTETVVGLVAGEAGLSRLFEIKSRDSGKPIAVLCGSTEEALALGHNIPPLARSLADRFWPGSSSGGSAPRALEEVDPAISAAVDFVVRGEPGSGEASAVVDLSGDNVRLLRATKSLTEDELTRLAKG
ncbi:MAG: Sua5/YciO/YrdC/YwlC family protein [Actinobacteria bacterium]|nr:Sua5/YciO/YrdC/YwlC family protein [Actinomycetota bacterium]